jgi:aminoglycoside phosphotransferase (APT) family kinase protein
MIRDFGLNGLALGWKWLAAHLPPAPAKTSILHLDYHPMNMLCGWFPALSVIDWTEADVGDLHADVATTLMLIACCSAGEPNAWERLTLPIARTFVSRWYLRSYRKRIHLDAKILAYYQALAALKRLCGYGRWLEASPLSTGCKPASLRYLNASHVQGLQAYFRRFAGVSVSLLPPQYATP